MNGDKENELRVGIILNYAATAIGLISSLVLNPFIIRGLGQGEYGLYETIGSFVNYLAVLDLGFSSVVVRYTAKYETEGDIKRRDEFLYIARRIYQYLGVAVLIGGAVLYTLLDDVFGNSFSAVELEKAHKLFLFVLGTTVLSIYGQVYAGALTGVEKFILPRIIRISKIIFGKVVCILVILLGADSVGYTAVLFAFEAAGLICNRIYAEKFVCFKKCRVRFSEIKELLVFTGFIFLQALAAQLYWQIDKLVLGSLIGTTVVAVYSVSLNLHNIVQNVSSSVKDILLPKATQIAICDGGAEKVQSFMIQAGRLIFMVYGLALAGLAILGREFILLWLGQEYVDAYNIYLVLGFSALLPSILGIGETVCRAYNKHQFLSYVSFAAAIINIVFTVTLVKKLGMIGAAIATAIGLIIAYTIIPIWYYKKTFSLSVFSYFLDISKGIIPALCATVVTGILANMIFDSVGWVTLIVKSVSMCCAYFASMVLFGLAKQEKARLLNYLYKYKNKFSR